MRIEQLEPKCLLASVPLIDNPGFETPAISESGFWAFQSGATGSAWTFTCTDNNTCADGNTGIAKNGSAFATTDAPEGVQAAFLQEGGAFWQDINFPEAGLYQIDFQAAYRDGYQGANPFSVDIDTQVVETVTPDSSDYQSYASDPVFITAGSHRLLFVGTAGADRTSLIDDVSITFPDTGGTQDPGLTLGSSAGVVTQGQPVTLTATLPGDATGAVTFFDGSTPLADPAALAGPAGSALQLDGSGYATLDTNPKFTSNDFTISLWFNPTSNDVSQYLLMRGHAYSDQQGDIGLKINPNTQAVDFETRTSDGEWLFGWGSVDLGQGPGTVFLLGGPLPETVFHVNGWPGELAVQNLECYSLYVGQLSACVLNVTSPNANGSYTPQCGIWVDLHFDVPVTVNEGGLPRLLLNNGEYATYESGSGTSTLRFLYTVQTGDNTTDHLDCTAFDLNGATIEDLFGDPVSLTLPIGLTPGSLWSNSTIEIDA